MFLFLFSLWRESAVLYSMLKPEASQRQIEGCLLKNLQEDSCIH